MFCDVVTIHGLNFIAVRPEKMAKLPVILGNLDVTIDNVAPDITSEFSTIKAPCLQYFCIQPSEENMRAQKHTQKYKKTKIL